jgi:ABC-2 type transport system permease protein
VAEIPRKSFGFPGGPGDAAALYFRLVAARLRSQLQYRTSLALETVGMFLTGFLDFAVILVLFHNVSELGEWTVAEVALLYGISGCAFALTDMAIGHLDLLSRLIRDGNFDLVFVRPRSTLFQVVTNDFHLRRLGKAAQALIVLGYALAANDIDWTFAKVAVFALAMVSAVAIFASVWIAFICIAFWTVEGTETANTFTYGGQFLTQYPINIYNAWLRRFLAYFVPTAFVAYFPALYILEKPDPLGLPSSLQVLSPLVAVATASGAGLVWRAAVRHYKSAGG